MKISIQIMIDPENGDPTVTKPLMEFRRKNIFRDIKSAINVIKNLRLEVKLQ